MQNILFTVCRLTAGRTPPTPRRSPPLLVLLVASTQTPPTDSVALLPSLHSHCGPLGPPSPVLISHHPSSLNSTATHGCTRISQNHTLCWNTGQLSSSWTGGGPSPLPTPRLHFNARISLTQNRRRMELSDAETNETSLLPRTF